MTHIRKIKTTDAEEIFNIIKKSWLSTYPNSEYWIKVEDILKRFEDTSRIQKMKENFSNYWVDSEWWVCEYDWKLVWVWITNLMWIECHVWVIYIIEEYQRKWIWKLLLDKILEFRENYNEIYAEVASYNTNAIHFYEKNGFKIIPWIESKHKIVDEIYMPTIMMKKELMIK